jgi:hypothetical protein
VQIVRDLVRHDNRHAVDQFNWDPHVGRWSAIAEHDDHLRYATLSLTRCSVSILLGDQFTS